VYVQNIAWFLVDGDDPERRSLSEPYKPLHLSYLLLLENDQSHPATQGIVDGKARQQSEDK
jgi:hypothetical protein